MKKPKAKKNKKKKAAASAKLASAFAGTSDLVAGVAMAGQEESNWCWAAVTQSCVRLLHNRSLSQEEIVTGHLQRTGRTYTCAPPNRTREDGGFCAPNSCTASCNDLHSIMAGLAGEGVQVQLLSNGTPGFAAIRQQIAARRPVPCQVLWNAGGGHIILIVGWSTNAGVEEVQVLDPQDAMAGVPILSRPVPHAALGGSYVQAGKVGRVRFSYKLI